jgi:hypothetical protein
VFVRKRCVQSNRKNARHGTIRPFVVRVRKGRVDPIKQDLSPGTLALD